MHFHIFVLFYLDKNFNLKTQKKILKLLQKYYGNNNMFTFDNILIRKQVSRN